jgi:hypothetical protein
MAASANGRTMIFWHAIVLILLGVDWLEDTQLGQSPFSCAMSSTPCNAHQESDQQDVVCVEPFVLSDQAVSFVSYRFIPLRPSKMPVLKYCTCFPSSHILMSLQL